MSRRPLFCYMLAVVQPVLLVAELSWGGGFGSPRANPMLGPTPFALLHFGAKFTPIQLNHAQHWRPFVSSFQYCGVVHLLLGFALGMPWLLRLERAHGSWRCGFIWLVSGWGGQLFSALLGPTLIGVGGSTAACGCIGAWWGHALHRHTDMSRDELRRLLRLSCACLLPLLVLGIFPFVNQWGQLSGLAIGLLASLFTLADYSSLRPAASLPGSGSGSPRSGRVRSWKPQLVVPAAVVFVVLITCVGYYFYTEQRPYSWCERCHWVECVDTAAWNCSPPAIPSICFSEPVGSYDSDNVTLTQGWC